MTLREKIVQRIRDQGPIPFSVYMALCLYDPELGYYSRTAEQFGKAGDFYTSSDVHAVFGRLLARQFDEMWRALGSPRQIEVLELGPGRGLFAQDVLDWSEKKFPEFFAALHYSLMERSPALRARLQKTLELHFQSGKAGMTATIARRDGCEVGGPDTGDIGKGATSQVQPPRASTPDVPLIIFANEFFDALPVDVVSREGELRIGEKDGRFVETWVPASSDELEYLERYGVRPEPGERLEVPLIAQHWVAQAAASIQRGFLIAVDYGYSRPEQLGGRYRGTLTVFRRHIMSGNPYEAPGEQDITAHVNFTAVASGACEQGMTLEPLLTQSQFLMGIGESNEFADAFADCRLPQERAKVALQLKHLITPEGMGESFRVLVGSKGVDRAQVARLRGLSFAERVSECRYDCG